MAAQVRTLTDAPRTIASEVDSDVRIAPIAVRDTRYLTGKRSFDLGCAVGLGFVLSPVLILVAGLVKATSRGPVLYMQTRLGKDGVPFRIVKFRSMSVDCEKGSGAKWATRNDPRVTPIGKFLRITHLDELPQLWNVLKGEMSLVGPRPERPEFTPILEAAIPNYRKRLLVRPGVAGLAQAYLPPDTGIDSVKLKLVYDLEYLRRISLWLDMRLMLITAIQAIGCPPKLARFLLRMPSPVEIERPGTTSSSNNIAVAAHGSLAS